MFELDVSEIFQKLRTKNDIINFFSEQNKQTIINFIYKYYSPLLPGQ